MWEEIFKIKIANYPPLHENVSLALRTEFLPNGPNYLATVDRQTLLLRFFVLNIILCNKLNDFSFRFFSVAPLPILFLLCAH